MVTPSCFFSLPSFFSTVTPGQLPTNWLEPVSALNRVVLPLFGFPASAIAHFGQRLLHVLAGQSLNQIHIFVLLNIRRSCNDMLRRYGSRHCRGLTLLFSDRCILAHIKLKIKYFFRKNKIFFPVLTELLTFPVTICLQYTETDSPSRQTEHHRA